MLKQMLKPFSRAFSLLRNRLLDITQRSPPKKVDGALRDIQKTAAKETIGP